LPSAKPTPENAAVPSPEPSTENPAVPSPDHTPPRLCLVFDIDDTLYLERDYVRSGFEAAGLYAKYEYGIGGLSTACWSLFQAGVRGDTFDRALAVLGVTPPPGLVSELIAIYRAHRPDIELRDDAAACLARWRERAFLGIVTDGSAISQRAKIEALKLDALVDLIVVTAELGRAYAKPAPGAFALFETASGLRGSACVYVADNPAKDFAGPHRLGWRTVRVRRHESLHADVPSGRDVDVEIASLAGLDEALGEAGGGEQEAGGNIAKRLKDRLGREWEERRPGRGKDEQQGKPE
jgi:putative hydrolase of the HAD superfamily